MNDWPTDRPLSSYSFIQYQPTEALGHKKHCQIASSSGRQVVKSTICQFVFDRMLAISALRQFFCIALVKRVRRRYRLESQRLSVCVWINQVDYLLVRQFIPEFVDLYFFSLYTSFFVYNFIYHSYIQGQEVCGENEGKNNPALETSGKV